LGNEALIDRDIFAAFAAAESTHWWFAARRSILRRVVDAILPSRPGRRVLDIGCGVASTLTAFHPDYACVGYDPSADAIGFARAHHPQFELHVGTSSQAAASIREVDVVLLNDVIEHVPDDRAMLGEVVAVCVPVRRSSSPSRRHAFVEPTRRADGPLPALRRGDACALGRGPAAGARHGVAFHVPPVPDRARGPGRVAVSRSRGGRKRHRSSYPPRPANAILREIFAGEGDRLLRILRGDSRPYRFGVSLLGVYRRT
jgi:SAM-dependent methyltransferase